MGNPIVCTNKEQSDLCENIAILYTTPLNLWPYTGAINNHHLHHPLVKIITTKHCKGTKERRMERNERTSLLQRCYCVPKGVLLLAACSRDMRAEPHWRLHHHMRNHPVLTCMPLADHRHHSRPSQA